ncbi:MAG: hypothetical protein ACM3ZB_15650 [bacterium]|jgi:predicted nucleotidyltransferase
MERLLEQLVDRLKKAFGVRLKSVILYGSAASGEREDRFSDYNVLCVLREVTPRELADSAAIVHWWREQGNPSPLMLSEEEVRNAADCFPIEFHDILERRRVLHGEDAVAGLVIHDHFYRAQVEYELRSKLLRLRQKAAGTLTDKNNLRVLMADSVSTFCVLIRHAMRLTGAQAPFEKRGVVQAASAHFGFDAAPFLRLLDLRENKVKPREVDPVPLLGHYMRQIQVVIDAVDRLEK